MYFIDFFKNVFKKNNIGVIIWLILNTFIVTVVLGSLFGEEWWSFCLGFVVYILLLAITLSPVGEAILRYQCKCKKITNQEYLNRLTPIFTEVYEKAKKKNPEIPDNVQFYINYEDEPNAFATGRRTVCITEGLLECSDSEIKAVLAHEFGHLAHKDTDAILIIEVGNLLVTGMFVVWRFLFNVVTTIMSFVIGIVSDSIAGVVVGLIYRVCIDFILVLAMKIWTKLGVLLCLHSARKNEKLADQYSYELGYGEYLCEFLDTLEPSKTKGLWAALNSSHPDSDKRIAYLKQLGCKYNSVHSF